MFDHGKSELTLKSEVVARLPMARVAAGHAIVSLAPGGAESKSRVVKAAELTGGVVVTELRENKAGVDKLAAQWARYRAEDGLPRFASPVDYWRGAERGRLDSETVEYVLGELKVPVGGKRECRRRRGGAINAGNPPQAVVRCSSWFVRFNRARVAP
jgi:hypothetical protein